MHKHRYNNEWKDKQQPTWILNPKYNFLFPTHNCFVILFLTPKLERKFSCLLQFWWSVGPTCKTWRDCLAFCSWMCLRGALVHPVIKGERLAGGTGREKSWLFLMRRPSCPDLPIHSPPIFPLLVCLPMEGWVMVFQKCIGPNSKNLWICYLTWQRELWRYD